MGSGEAFGIAHPSWDEGDFVGREFQMNDLQWVNLSDAVETDKVDALQNYVMNLVLHSSGVYQHFTSEAEGIIFTTAVNDVKALVGHVIDLDGRSAAHCARALFEHLVNFLDVTNSKTNTAKRYTDHQVMVRDVVAKRRAHLDLLDPRARKSETKRLDSLASRVAAHVSRLRAQYGRSFRAQWAEGNLFDRAKLHGVDDQYDGYRLLSSVIHGSSGGADGLTKNVQGATVYRTGSDLEMARIALFEGLNSFKLFADKVDAVAHSWESERIVEETEQALALWPSIRAGLKKLDRKLWKKIPPPGPLAILAIYPTGERWYYYHPAADAIMPADPPATEPKHLSQFRAKAKDYDPQAFNGRPMTAIVSDVKVRPKEGARPVPASAILVPGGHPGRRRKPRVVSK